MACRGCLECLLKLLNFLLAVAGLGMIGYGIYLFVEYKKAIDGSPTLTSSGDQGLLQLGRPMLMAISLSSDIFDKLPKAWFIYLFIGIGAILFVVSCFGCLGVCTRSGCCLSCITPLLASLSMLRPLDSFTFFIFLPLHVLWLSYQYSVLVFLLILVELGCAAFIFFDKSWKQELPTDKTGDFDMIYSFLKENWKIVRWVALGAVIFQALLFLLALMVRAANAPPDYDSDDELLAPRNHQIRQPFLNRQPAPATGVPVAPTLDPRPGRNDAWSTRMREKYGLDTSEFTYNPSESHRFQQVPTQAAEEKGRCTIM